MLGQTDPKAEESLQLPGAISEQTQPSFQTPGQPRLIQQKSQSILTPPKQKLAQRLNPFRSNSSNSTSGNTVATGAQDTPLALLKVRLYSAKDLIAKDKNGFSDPFPILSFGDARARGTVVFRSLDPIWHPGSISNPEDATDGDADLVILVTSEDGQNLARKKLNIVLWDQDRVGKDYLGELSLDFSDWIGGMGALGFNDSGNQPKWYPLRSSRKKKKSTPTNFGDIQLKLGFLPLPTNDLNRTLSGDDRANIVRILEIAKETYETAPMVPVKEKRSFKQRFYKRREQSVLMVEPTSGVGTIPWNRSTQGPTGSFIDNSDSDSDYSDAEDQENDSDSDSDSSSLSDEELSDVDEASSNSATPVTSIFPDTSTSGVSTPVNAMLAPPVSANKTRRKLKIPSFLKRGGSSSSFPATSLSEEPTLDLKKETKKSPFKKKGKKSEKMRSKKHHHHRANRMTRTSSVHYKYYDRDGLGTLGLVSMHIVGAEGLPRFPNMLKTGYDMDPFVVISFGKRVFRTRVIRHSLSPQWNEMLYFSVGDSESKWNVTFDVLDWDKVSSNDFVCSISLPLENLLGSSIKPGENTLYPTGSDGLLVENDFIEHQLLLPPTDSWPKTESPARLHVAAKFTPYTALRQQFWRLYLGQFDVNSNGAYSYLEILSMLDSLGSTLVKETIESFFTRFQKNPEIDELSVAEVVMCLETEIVREVQDRAVVVDDEGFGDANDLVDTPDGMTVAAQQSSTVKSSKSEDFCSYERVINIKECPLCRKPRLSRRAELDIITHLGICASTDPDSVNRIMAGEYVTASQAQRKWMTKIITSATRGSYQLGADSANIIVQDRITGALLEEKMSVYVRMGIRIMYRSKFIPGGVSSSHITRLLESLSIKQGIKYDSPASAKDIAPFIAFHALNMEEALDPVSDYKTFNEFFYRKLKPDARVIDGLDDPDIVVSPADCRAMFFPTIDDATSLWIKGREFSIERMLGEEFKGNACKYNGGSLAIFRLAPQDYHRYHSPVDGVCGKQTRISGKYYTVNPMAIRSSIDVYGDNVRVVQPIASTTLGEVMNVWVGAMMVGSILMSDNTKPGKSIKKGDETGYFAFGGSTIVVLFEPGKVVFDHDLVKNSRASVETLVKMGMRIGRKRKDGDGECA